jgi:hypothetical protein
MAINSKHFLTKIENDIVQLVKAIAVERQVSVDEAKISARRSIQHKINQMLTTEEQDGIQDLLKETNNLVKKLHKDNIEEKEWHIYSRKVYELLKTMGF